MSTDETILRVLAGQSSDYLIKPEATAFAVEGVSPADALASLKRLEALGYAREDEVVATAYDPETGELVDAVDEEGNPVVLDTGWACTDAGHAAAVKHADVPDPVQLAGVLYAAIASADDFAEAKANLAAVAHVMGASDPK